MSSIIELKKQLSKSKEKLIELSSENKKGVESYNDDRYWYPGVDKSGNGSAIIRFLPAPNGEDFPYVGYWTHSFKGPTGLWYIENCLSSIGEYESDPVNQLNKQYWDSNNEELKKLASLQKRKRVYVSNVYIVKDPLNPENEGKVKLFKYGKKIHEMIIAKLRPDEGLGEEPVNVFDPWEGCFFRLKIANVSGYRNYDKSSFDTVKPLADDDATIEKIWKSCHSLKEIVDPKHFKSYDMLKAKLDRVIGSNSSKPSLSKKSTKKIEIEEEEDEIPFETSSDSEEENVDDFLQKIAARSRA